MYNPFDEIIKLLNGLYEKVSNSSPATIQHSIEIIDRTELCKRLAITEPTVIRWEKKGQIPSIRIGSNVRYNWPAVIQALENKQSSQLKHKNLKAISLKGVREIKMDRKN